MPTKNQVSKQIKWVESMCENVDSSKIKHENKTKIAKAIRYYVSDKILECKMMLLNSGLTDKEIVYLSARTYLGAKEFKYFHWLKNEHFKKSDF